MAVVAETLFRNMEPSDAIRDKVSERMTWLERQADRITHLRVIIEAPHRNHHKGKIYHVKIAIGLPGRPDLVVSHEPEVNHAHEDVYIAIRDAFDAARRQLKDINDVRNGRTKTHPQTHGDPGTSNT
jgi:ribosomal subunit interface protein